ncbi:Uu.00g052470.m01.CDS01 [Anthostomella pinea]|uniref:Uu.00g052470.m01.CDS01 n=1 Tax=Anthostomella pinea TaxID=933095 RepID=A0AAI8VW72_9PEZI|nr:Uu.00g052470.m01.CDS01 [Anthostomella pinea]
MPPKKSINLHRWPCSVSQASLLERRAVTRHRYASQHSVPGMNSYGHYVNVSPTLPFAAVGKTVSPAIVANNPLVPFDPRANTALKLSNIDMNAYASQRSVPQMNIQNNYVNCDEEVKQEDHGDDDSVDKPTPTSSTPAPGRSYQGNQHILSKSSSPPPLVKVPPLVKPSPRGFQCQGPANNHRVTPTTSNWRSTSPGTASTGSDDSSTYFPASTPTASSATYVPPHARTASTTTTAASTTNTAAPTTPIIVGRVNPAQMRWITVDALPSISYAGLTSPAASIQPVGAPAAPLIQEKPVWMDEISPAVLDSMINGYGDQSHLWGQESGANGHIQVETLSQPEQVLVRVATVATVGIALGSLGSWVSGLVAERKEL